MNRLLVGLARAGDAWDTAARATPRRLRAALAVPRHRRTGLIAAAVVLVAYLFSIGDLAVSASGRLTGVQVFQTAWGRVFQARAPYLFEPVVAVHPSAHLAVFISPLNLLLGGMVAALVGCNVAVAGHAARQAAACRATRRRRGYARLLGVLPAFLLGFACCVPTVLLVLGTGTAAVLLPVLIPLRPVFYPLTLVLLTAALVGQSRASRAARMSAGSARVV